MLLARDRDLLVGVCCVPHLQGVVRRAPRPSTVVILMTRDTRMRTGDAYYVSAVGYCPRVSRLERTVLRQSPWCRNIIVASQLVVLDVPGTVSAISGCPAPSAGCGWRPGPLCVLCFSNC